MRCSPIDDFFRHPPRYRCDQGEKKTRRHQGKTRRDKKRNEESARQFLEGGLGKALEQDRFAQLEGKDGISGISRGRKCQGSPRRFEVVDLLRRFYFIGWYDSKEMAGAIYDAGVG